MKFSLWCRPHSVCEKCGVHFEPVTGKFVNLCSLHRQPLIEHDRKLQAVLSWAANNVDLLYPMMLKEAEEQAQKYRDLGPFMQMQQAQLGAAQAAFASMGNLGQLGGLEL